MIDCADVSDIDTTTNSYVSMLFLLFVCWFFFSSRRRHTRSLCDWSSDVCSSDLSIQFAWTFWTNVRNWVLDADVDSIEIQGEFAAGICGVTHRDRKSVV